MLLQKEAKQGQGGPNFPLDKPLLRLAVLATNLDFSQPKNLNPYCAQMRSKGSLRQHLPPPPCGARKNHRAARLLDFFDRYGCSASLHPPLAALGSAPPAPFPDAGGLYQQSLHKNAPAAPYKRRRVGCNLRLSRADPALCSGQPSPLRCILLSPQGLTTLRGPQFYGVYRRVGASGTSPNDFCLLFFMEK